jgi:hypothetical protein
MMNTAEAVDSRRKNSGAVEKRSYPEGHMVCCVALQTAQLNVYSYM